MGEQESAFPDRQPEDPKLRIMRKIAMEQTLQEGIRKPRPTYNDSQLLEGSRQRLEDLQKQLRELEEKEI